MQARPGWGLHLAFSEALQQLCPTKVWEPPAQYASAVVRNFWALQLKSP